MRLCVTALVTAYSSTTATSQVTGGARTVALAGATTALDSDPWAEANPAAWGTVETRAVAFYGSEAFGLSELRTGAMRYVEVSNIGAFAAGAETFGFDDFRDTRLLLGYGNGFQLGTSRNFYVGAAVEYIQVSITDYGSDQAIGISAGWLAELAPTLWAGFSALNLNRPGVGGSDELERSVGLGLQYHATENLRLLVDASKDVRFPVSFRGALELTPVSQLVFRTGVATEPTRFAGGVGVRMGWIQADIAADRHQDLGWSPAVSLTLSW